jgi:hypothetical protein
MENSDSLSLEIMGVKAAANGQFAISLLISAAIFFAIVFLIGRRRGWW